MEYTVDGLLPFTEYKAELSVSNMYTIRKDYLDALFSSTIQFTTLEGGKCISYSTQLELTTLLFTLICYTVPSPPTGVSFVPFGTADIQIRWAMPNPDTVRGPGQTFYVQIFDNGTLRGELQVDELSIFVNASVGVISGLVQDIVVSYVCGALKGVNLKLWEQTLPHLMLITNTLTSVKD